MSRRDDAYAEAVGADALERQRRAAKECYPCCGERREVGHHPSCSKRPWDSHAPVPGQLTLMLP